MRAAVFLDRDGVLNRCAIRDGKPYAPRTVTQFRLLPGVRDAIGALRQAGYLIVIVTNQPDIGNHLIDRSVVDAMHDRLRAVLAPDAIEVCPHSQDAGCECRKPKPGLLVRAALRLDIELERSFMVGDRWSDIVAGHALGCHTILVRRRYREEFPVKPDTIVGSMAAAARKILSSADGRERADCAG
jgi:D-glycero-D-manno-heptose 1,7-bisphosphate phosphatase